MGRAVDGLSFAALVALLVWAPVALGAYRSWPLAVAEGLAFTGLALHALAMLAGRRLEWRRTPLDWPVLLALGADPAAFRAFRFELAYPPIPARAVLSSELLPADGNGRGAHPREPWTVTQP